jgi:hypothetical protein
MSGLMGGLPAGAGSRIYGARSRSGLPLPVAEWRGHGVSCVPESFRPNQEVE